MEEDPLSVNLPNLAANGDNNEDIVDQKPREKEVANTELHSQGKFFKTYFGKTQ